MFDSPRDTLIWDTGHQAYVHKLLTGRHDGWERLKLTGGPSGYPSRAESPHDHVENSHASTSLSWADGIARGYALTGQRRHVVAVIGDGALTGGMAWEALNNIAAAKDRNLVIVVNDNGRSYAPTIGGVADRLSSLRLQPGYERVLEKGKQALTRTPVVGGPLYAALHALKAGVKDALAPQELFSDLGIKYFGPVEGHNVAAVESALRRARGFGGPVIVHVVTQKGRGYPPAENDAAEQMHSPAAFDPVTGLPTGPPSVGWTSVFADELVKIGAVREDVVAITAAMLGPTGLVPFAEAFPERCIDVGIAEQHAFTSAAGLAYAGLHPVVAVYSTFLNRAFDQLLLDVALHRQAVTLVLDRAGVTGNDGPSHNGMWDLSLLGIVPGMRVAAPRDADTLREELAEAVAVDDGPTAIRFPKGAVIESVPAVRRVDGVDVLHEGGAARSCSCARGRSGSSAWPRRRGWHGRGCRSRSSTRGGCCRCPPPSSAMAREHRLVVALSRRRAARRFRLGARRRAARGGVRRPVRDLAIPQEFLEHGSRADVLAAVGLGEQDVARRITEWAAALLPERAAQNSRGVTLMRVLVVEDEAALADAVARGLRREGMAVDVAYDGDSGHEKATRHPVRRGGARPGPARDARRRPVRADRLLRRHHAGAHAHGERHPGRQGRRPVPGRRRLPGEALRLPRARGPLPGARPPRHPGRAAVADGRRRRAGPGPAHRQPGGPVARPHPQGVRGAGGAARRAGRRGEQRGAARTGVGRERRPVHHHRAGHRDDVAQEARRARRDRDGGRGGLPGPRRGVGRRV